MTYNVFSGTLNHTQSITPICTLSRYKEMRVIVLVTKTCTFFTVILRPFSPGRQNFNTRDLSPAYT